MLNSVLVPEDRAVNKMDKSLLFLCLFLAREWIINKVNSVLDTDQVLSRKIKLGRLGKGIAIYITGP